jgi:uncharacterized membrane protein
VDALEHVATGWAVVRRHLVAWVALAAVWACTLPIFLLGLLLAPNLLRVTARALEDGGPPRIADLFDGRRLLDDLVLLALIVAANAVGSVVPGVGGVIVGTLLVWTPMLVVDGHYGPLEAATVSVRAVLRDPVPALVFTLASGLLLVGATVLCGVPALVALPVVLVASWTFYEAERVRLLEVGDTAGVPRR